MQRSDIEALRAAVREAREAEAAALECEACPLAATQAIHGSHLCDRCARESKRLERER